jgi:hypothetical protein
MKKLLVLSMMALMFQSCALMISGANQKITFESETEGATVLVNNDSLGVTNEEVKIPRAYLYGYYTVSKEGCRDTSFSLPIQSNWLTLIDAPLVLPLLFDYAYRVDVKTEKIIKIDLDCSGD